MNINAKNLIRLRALSPKSSVNVKVESVNVIEREKTHIQSRVKRFRENKKGGWKPTHIIELQGRVICVYGLESNNKTEYAVTCGGINEAKELWDELFSEYVIECPKVVDKVSTKSDDKFEVITPYEFIDLMELNDRLRSLSEEYNIIVDKINNKILFVSEMTVNLKSSSIDISYKYTSVLSIMKNGVIRLTINDDVYLCSEFKGNLEGARSFMYNDTKVKSNYIDIEKLKELLSSSELY